ncbi:MULTISPECIES: hypothetical protein [unclassified Nostoc]|uniref:hypothetical protein n=1 Tax=unclassified Nostoc TaxID=2593658 RepID=UPI00262FB237|nr:hypothetical protein [Nostoc sp. S13]MDF5738898.1 hypothetical protein [Nostoc sp. S13]
MPNAPSDGATILLHPLLGWSFPQEYIVWRTLDNQLDWFRLQADEYVSLPTDEQGIIRSQVFPGLWLAVSALLSEEIATVLSVLQAGLAATEHQEFMQKLK